MSFRYFEKSYSVNHIVVSKASGFNTQAGAEIKMPQHSIFNAIHFRCDRKKYVILNDKTKAFEQNKTYFRTVVFFVYLINL